MFQNMWELYDYAYVILMWYELLMLQSNVQMIKCTWERYCYKECIGIDDTMTKSCVRKCKYLNDLF